MHQNAVRKKLHRFTLETTLIPECAYRDSAFNQASIDLMRHDLRHVARDARDASERDGQAGAQGAPDLLRLPDELLVRPSCSRTPPSTPRRARSTDPLSTYRYLPRAPSFRLLPSSRRGEALWERVEAGSGSLGAASSESAAGSGRLRACGSSCG
jgi:hypothetical protein